MHSLQLARDAEQVQYDNPWSPPSRGGDLSAAARGHPHSDTRFVLRDDTVSPALSSWQDRDMIIPPSPPPEPTEPIHPQPPIQMEATETPQPNPHIASLKAIFPDFDDAVILSVLESTDDDHDRALDALLGMSDPSFVPPASPPPPPRSPEQFRTAPSSDPQRLSQEALDEQFARRLALEEQEAAQDVPSYVMYQPYQTRQGARNSWSGRSRGQAQTQGQGGRDTMTEFQEGFSRIAESGKKTFSSIVSKVRAKMQEFEQGQGWSGSQSPPPDQTTQPARRSSYSSHAFGQQQDPGRDAYAQSYGSPQQADRTNSDAWQPIVLTGPEPAHSLRPSYYDPNHERGYDLYGDDDATIAGEASPTALAPASSPVGTRPEREYEHPATLTAVRTSGEITEANRASSGLGLGQGLPPLSETRSPVVSPPSSTPPPPFQPSASPPARSLSPTIAGGADMGASAGSPGGGTIVKGPTRSVDFSKLGLLPKRPISLVQAQSPPAAGGAVSGAGTGAGASLSAPRIETTHSGSSFTTASSTGREEPEFVENPFEDQT